MSLEPGDREWCKLISKEIAYTINKEVIAEHIKTCPFGMKLLVGKYFCIGIAFGIGLVSGGGGFLIAKILSGL
tara:strand:- start:368 stop:586 length:219 start_codon:yes stop_codon:yes gene_type:complete